MSAVKTKKPVAVTRPFVYLVDSTKLSNTCDIKADDLGVWLHKGKPIRHYQVSGCVYGADLTWQKTGQDIFSINSSLLSPQIHNAKFTLIRLHNVYSHLHIFANGSRDRSFVRWKKSRRSESL